MSIDSLATPAAPAVRRRVRRKATRHVVVDAPAPDQIPFERFRFRRHRTGAGARLNADNYWLYLVIAGGVIATIFAGIVASWEGLIQVSNWGVFPPEHAILMPILIDLPISILALASLALKSRGRPGLAAWMLTLSILFTAFSGFANFIYVADKNGLDDYKDWTAAVFKGLAPAIQLVMVEVLGVLVAKPAGEKTKLVKAHEQNKALKAENAKLRRDLRKNEAAA